MIFNLYINDLINELDNNSFEVAILNKINEINYKNNIMILSNDNKEENII